MLFTPFTHLHFTLHTSYFTLCACSQARHRGRPWPAQRGVLPICHAGLQVSHASKPRARWAHQLGLLVHRAAANHQLLTTSCCASRCRSNLPFKGKFNPNSTTRFLTACPPARPPLDPQRLPPDPHPGPCFHHHPHGCVRCVHADPFHKTGEWGLQAGPSRVPQGRGCVRQGGVSRGSKCHWRWTGNDCI